MAAFYTLWTYPSECRRHVDGLEVTEDLLRKIEQAVANLREDDIADRLRPYNTPVTQKTMRQEV